MLQSQVDSGGVSSREKWLFWACFMALIATAFGFVVRGMILDEWAVQFNLSQVQKGEIGGAGLWPFAISIVLFSLIIDRIGYGTAMIFAFACHVLSVIIILTAKGYGPLYTGNFILALGNGTVEAVINPVVATMFVRNKTKWLNMLHAGWPGGLVLGGLITIALGAVMGVNADWRLKFGLMLIPTIAYGLMMIGQKFPVHERVLAGVSFRDMLREVGAVGAFIIIALMCLELGKDFNVSTVLTWLIIVALTAGYGFYTKSAGRPLFVILVLIMIPLATTELGTDSWISDLMTPAMAQLNLQGGWVLVYTSFVMMLLRFSAGPIVHRFSPLVLLACCSAVAALGLVFLSFSAGVVILAAATLYACGKSFFWPTMLGVVAEQFPRGGALTMNTIAGVGMISVGIIGMPFIGSIQDKNIDRQLQIENSALHQKLIVEKSGIFGRYNSVDEDKLAASTKTEQAQVAGLSADAKKTALRTIAILPVIMFLSYLGLLVYFRSRGGYRIVHLDELEEPVPSEY